MNPDNIRIVLLGTTHPGNIGSAARAMKTMGLSRLHLVAPLYYPDPRAQATAGHAADVLGAAHVHADLAAALHDTRLVLGLTARPRRLAAEALDARCGALQIAEASRAYPVALLFGREDSGLTNAQLSYCHGVVHIPANPAYPVLNLAAAVQIVCYELFLAGRCLEGERGEPSGSSAAPPAPMEELEGFYCHLQRIMQASGYSRHRPDALLMRRLRRLFNRARPERAELNLLRGILTAIERRLG
ncbi:RNA methyltransferase [Nitrococcus mobilis]|uniref:tRNA (cytidine/uridine-2'-O-)-methyltransferase TrmJ n=1 Tax=Nitrococcus mobilis Nb-231 TaxID=314278 RepID=A4BSU5_9GAMM|nr:RNA methyltransferase [Nitrococcus mobilis]EAR21189.1 rRNA_methyl_1: RNA methyltransferase, TrmHfamily, group 1 [Nitrococcus mobilis Nb-231]